MTLPDYFMPAEWQPHSRTIMALAGHASHSYWPSGTNHDMNTDVKRVALAIARFEHVTIYVAKSQAEQMVQIAGNAIEVRVVEDDDVKPWMRDIAPTFVVARNSTVCGINFHFNGWGDKDRSESNRRLAGIILDHLRVPVCETWLVAEGGALETDGEGTLLATESSLVNANRNPGRNRAAIEGELKRILGVSKVIWLAGVSAADTTDCHVDALARFARPGLVVLSRPSAARPRVWTAAYENARDVLSAAKDAKGRSLEIVALPEPDITSIRGADPEMIPSYVNYFHASGAVIVPQFGSPETDAGTLSIMGQLFPDKELCPVDLHGLPNAGGGLHCATQQVPVGMQEG